MTKRFIAVIALVLAALAPPIHAQTKGTAVQSPVCDSTSILLTKAIPFTGVQKATIAKSCFAFSSGLDAWFTANADSLLKLSNAQLVALIVHGTTPKPPAVPIDTVVPPPPVKDTTKIPPRDTTKAPPADTTTPPPVATTWTFCTNAGAMCDYFGLRVVQLCDVTETKCVQQTTYHEVPCAGYGFNNQYPSSGPLHCRYGPPITESLVATVMGPITSPYITVFKGSPGSSTADVQNGGGNGSYTDGTGSFRTTCSLAHMAFDDPIVFPGQPGKSHLHMFFGNTAISAYTDSSTIVTTGNSTCRGGILNRTAYWTPAMVDGAGNVVMPDEATIYYKTGYNMPPAKTQVLPTGLRMIAGDKNATGAQVAPGPLPIAAWDCLMPDLTAVKDKGGKVIQSGYTIPGACPAGAMVRLTIFFPSCWNGKDLDSPDHKSHMAYPNFVAGTCAQGWVQLPQISEHFDFPVLKGANPATWHLSSDGDLTKPGMSAHADWMMGWDATTMKSIVENCLQKAVDCGVGGIGANKSLF
ncbi:MAG TPA: DUF1996 domain-containing protein [Gemmatimonadaceae bacterium]|jgi:hypothetical protein